MGRKMRVKITVQVYDDGDFFLASNVEEVRASLNTLRDCIDWDSVGRDVILVALGEAQVAVPGCPDAD